MSFASLFTDPGALWRGLLSFPPFCLALAVLATAAILILVPSRSRADRQNPAPSRPVTARYAPEQRILASSALLVIVVFMLEFLFRGYVLADPERISWWRFATPIATAALAVGVTLGVMIARESTRPQRPATFSARRGWLTFSSRRDLAVVAGATLVLLATTVAAGAVSSPDGEGRYAWLDIPVPNEPNVDEIRVLFFGWAFGIAVIISAAALAILTFLVLQRNAARPFLGAETMTDERAARRSTAAMATRLAASSLILALAEAWKLIADAGTGGQLTVISASGAEQTYEAAWKYAELATIAGWVGPLLEIAAFGLLLLTAYRGLVARAAGTATRPAGPPMLNEEIPS